MCHQAAIPPAQRSPPGRVVRDLRAVPVVVGLGGEVGDAALVDRDAQKVLIENVSPQLERRHGAEGDVPPEPGGDSLESTRISQRNLPSGRVLPRCLILWIKYKNIVNSS